MKIRIVSPGWENFSGMFAAVKFENGVSVDDVAEVYRKRIASSVRVVDADDASERQIGPAQDVIDFATVRAPEMISAEQKALALAAQIEREAQARAEADAKAAAEADALAAAKEKAATAAESFAVYSRTELEAIGADGGIQALRDIAKPLGVKGRAIDELITEILAAQDKRVRDAS